MEWDLYVGDVHATPDSLDECGRLIRGVAQVARSRPGLRRIVLLGDQHDTHSVVRVEVMSFWHWGLEELLGAGPEEGVVMLKGNHDESGDGRSHALLAYVNMEGVTVVGSPAVWGTTLYLPYMRSNEAFVAACRAHPRTPLAVCHQSFLGACYENGTDVPDGVDPALLPQRMVISGHIHSAQDVVRPGAPPVRYVGAPRWRSRNDANQARRVWAVTYGEDGLPASWTGHDTAAMGCRPILSFRDTPEQPAAVPRDSGADVCVDVHGPAAYLAVRVPELRAAGCRVRAFRTDLGRASVVRESDGMPTAFGRFAAGWRAPGGTPTEVLAARARGRLQGVL